MEMAMPKKGKHHDFVDIEVDLPDHRKASVDRHTFRHARNGITIATRVLPEAASIPPAELTELALFDSYLQGRATVYETDRGAVIVRRKLKSGNYADSLLIELVRERLDATKAVRDRVVRFPRPTP
jgi:hypothetical protein